MVFHATDFVLAGRLTLDGQKVLGTGELSGKWFDGTPWSIRISQHDATATILVPEPATIGLLAAGCVTLLRGRRE